MAQIKTVTTTSGTNSIKFDVHYPYIWFKNLGTGDVYVSDNSQAQAGADDTALLKAGEIIRITAQTDTVYVVGATTVEVHAQGFADCSFKPRASGSGGGASNIDYSTEEQNTGRKWIDGKPIYQITTLVSGRDLFDASELAIDKLIKVEALGSDGVGYTSNKWTLEAVSGVSGRVIYWSRDNNKIIYDGSQSSYPIYAATIWYTKTTDTGVIVCRR